MEEDEEKELREQELNKEEERIEAMLDGEQKEWEQHKTKKRDKERRGMAKGSRGTNTGSKKRTEQDEEDGARRKKRRKYELLREDWGRSQELRKLRSSLRLRRLRSSTSSLRQPL